MVYTDYLKKMIKMIKLDHKINNSDTEKIQKCQCHYLGQAAHKVLKALEEA